MKFIGARFEDSMFEEQRKDQSGKNGEFMLEAGKI